MADHDGITLVEEWRPIRGYESFYEVSTKGRVRSLNRTAKHPRSKSGTCLRKGKILTQHPNTWGYLQVSLCVNGSHATVRVARLVAEAFGIVTPEQDIDHRDRKKRNNAITNLRPATDAQNGYNKGPHKNNTSGFRGVDWRKNRNAWNVRITVNGERFGLGLFKNLKDAVAARRAAELKYHGEFAASA